MKRTLKRESKVLEIVKREAIGAGGSFLSPGLFNGDLLVGRAAAMESAHVPPFCVRPGAPLCIQSRRRASIGFMFNVVADGRLGIKGPGRPASQPCPAGATQRTCHRRDRGTN